MNITITLTIDETNYVLSALGSRPFAEVADLVFKIKNEAESQITPAPASEAPATAE